MTDSKLFNVRCRRTLTVLMLGASLISAAPAMAQPSTAFGLQFNFGTQMPRPLNPGFFGKVVPRAICLSDAQIRRSISNRGYSDISLNVPNDKHVQVRASKGGFVYLLDYNFCTDRIEGRNRLHATQ